MKLSLAPFGRVVQYGLRGNLCRAAHIRRHQKLYEFLPEAIAADIAPPGRGQSSKVF